MRHGPPLARTVAATASLALAAVLLAGCASSPATPTPTAALTTAAPTATSTATATPAQTATATAGTAAATYRDATYTVEGRAVTLVNGLSEVAAAPGSASKVTTRVFGNEATGDLNADGAPDVGFVLTQSGGGSGTFYYAVAALKTANGWTGTNAVLLGDRIAPQSTTIQNGTLTVNYADRKPGEPFTAQPSVGVSKVLKVVNGKLVE